MKLRAKALERLVDAEPKFYTRHGVPGRIGLTFACPIHEDCLIGIPFANPLDGAEPLQGRNLWKRDGETFDALTLSPSIHSVGDEHTWKSDDTCAVCRARRNNQTSASTPCLGCGWHGFIKAGRFETCSDSR